MHKDLLKQLDQAAEFIIKRCSMKPSVGLTLGSGLGHFADEIEINASIPYQEIPHFVPPTVDGHPGRLLIGHVKDVPVCVLQGRIHYYEGHDLQQVVFPTRVLARLGVTKLILTNAAGGIAEGMKPGDFMLIRDHINLFGVNPLRGPNLPELGPRFPDMSEAYSRRLIAVVRDILREQNLRFHEGIYCGVSGPTYETPAEIMFYRAIGAGAVGMSTVPETLAARHMGVEVAGISCITNLAAGLSPGEISHEDVKEVADKVATQFTGLIREAICRIGRI